MKRKIILLALALFLITALSIPTAAAEIEPTDGTASLEYENPADEVYAQILSHSSEIFSALSFIGSLVIMIVYKKAVTPSIGRILSLLGKAEKESAERRDTFDVTSATLCSIASFSEGTLSLIEERMKELEAHLASLSNKQRDDALSELLSAQVDMLYEIFMSATLPQYEKDRVGERIAEMKRSLALVKGYDDKN